METMRTRAAVQPSPADIEAVAARYGRVIVPVDGDCLEGVSVMDGGWVAVDFTRRPAPPRFKAKGGDGSSDLCLCYAAGRLMVKQYLGAWGRLQLVGTRYRGPRLNCAMPAERIFGVIIASWGPDGALLWGRAPETFPAGLPDAPTIRGKAEPV